MLRGESRTFCEVYRPDFNKMRRVVFDSLLDFDLDMSFCAFLTSIFFFFLISCYLLSYQQKDFMSSFSSSLLLLNTRDWFRRVLLT